MLFPCSSCDKECKDISSFNIHHKVAHQNVSKFTCKINKCSRQFDVYNSFRRHLIIGHHIPIFACDDGPKIVSNVNSEDHFEDHFISSHLEDALEETTQPVDEPLSASANSKALLQDQEDRLVAKLYQNPAFPRNLVNKMVADFKDYLSSPFFENLQKIVTTSLDPNLSPDLLQEIAGMFRILSNPFHHLETEYKRLMHFENCGAYIPPVSYTIYTREERVKSKGKMTLNMRPVLGQYVPLDKVLTKFFELPHVLEDTLSYMKELKSDSNWLVNLTQCDIWKRKVSRFDENDIVIPLNLYYDDVEPNKALGPHCEPLGCTYVQIATLPPEWSSRLENIFLVLIFDAHNRSLYSNKKVFWPLIKVLKKLETEGIIVTIPGLGTFRLFVVVALLLGDNKALNEICGFVACFTANHYCRICKVFREAAWSMFEEDVNLLRTPENYQSDLLLNDSTETGIKEKCIFSELPSFEIPTDICIDEFHDLIEGVAHYTMIPVLKHFHRLNDSFISTLNNRLYCMDLGVDSDNRPPLINLDILLNKSKLKMTGAEMTTFIRIFGILIHDLVPENDPYYQLYLLLNDIRGLLHAKGISRDAGKILALKVKEHNKLYCLLTKLNLKPKHHFLLHYARLLILVGPFASLSTIRYEAKHRLVTMTANACMSRINLPRTVAIKHQLGFCFRVVSRTSIRQDITYGPIHLVDLSELDTFPSFRLTLPASILDDPTQCVVSWVTYKGTTYKPKDVVLFDVDDIGLFMFAEIEIIVIINEKPIFICSLLDTIGYFSEVRGYEVSRMTDKINWFAIDQEKLLDPQPLFLYKMSSGEHVVVLKYTI